MAIESLDHVTVVTRDLDASVSFYTQLLDMNVADFRPPFSFGGAWLALGDRAVVHLVVARSGEEPSNTLPFDHFALKARNIVETRRRLEENGVRFQEQTTPDDKFYQLFFTDPNGVKIELNFDLPAEKSAGTA